MATEQVGFAVRAKQSGVTKASGLSRFLNQYFYFSMSLLIAAVVVYGFSHTVNTNLIHATLLALIVCQIAAILHGG